jgi:biopolymer transport protein ExbD
MNSPSQKAICRAAERRSAVQANINLWPLVGLLLVSLVTFRTIRMPSPYPSHGFVDRRPPGRRAVLQPGPELDDAIRISVLPHGRIIFRNTMVVANDLAALITAAVKQGSEKKIYLSADLRARNRDVQVILDQIRTAGMTRVAIMTN